MVRMLVCDENGLDTGGSKSAGIKPGEYLLTGKAAIDQNTRDGITDKGAVSSRTTAEVNECEVGHILLGEEEGVGG